LIYNDKWPTLAPEIIMIKDIIKKMLDKDIQESRVKEKGEC